MKPTLLAGALAFLVCSSLSAQKVRTVTWTTIEDESKVPGYFLPDPLLCRDGTRVTTLEQWEQVRRPELVDLLTTCMYGRTPEVSLPLGYELLGYEPGVFGGLAKRKAVRLFLSEDKGSGPCVEAFVYSPNGGHTVNEFDWLRFIEFADKYLK